MNDVFLFLKRFEKYTKNTDLMMAAGLLTILAVMLVPLPPFMLDIALTLSLAVSILILLVSLYIKKSLELSVFPSFKIRMKSNSKIGRKCPWGCRPDHHREIFFRIAEFF